MIPRSGFVCRVLAVSLVLLGISVALAEPRVRGEYYELRADVAVLISNGDQQLADELIAQYAHFRAAIGALLPVAGREHARATRIHMFRRESTFRHYGRLLGAPDKIDAFFVATPSAHLILLHQKGLQSDPGLVYHEALHQIVSESLPGLPLWLNEGLAEYVSTFWSDDEQAELGLAHPAYLYRMREVQTLDLSALLDVAPRSPDYREPGSKSLFHARSWALVHYLMSSGAKPREAIPLYLERVRNGDDRIDAFAQAFGIEAANIERDVFAHLRREPLPSLRLTLRPDSNAHPPVAPLPRAETLFRLGEMLSFAMRSDAAEAHFRASLAADPAHLPARANLSELLIRLSRADETRDLLARGLELAPGDPRLLRLEGMRLLSPHLEGLGVSVPQNVQPPGGIRAARRAFELAIESDDSSALAWAGAAAACLFEPPGSDDETRCAQLLSRARQRFPGHGEIACRHASFLARRDQWSDARARLQEARLASPRDAWIRRCEALVGAP